MYTAVTIANYFIYKSIEDSSSMNALRINKLVQLAHGWYLSFTEGKSLIYENIEAWLHASMIEPIWDEYEKHGTSDIKEIKITRDDSGQNLIKLIKGNKDSKFLDKIYESYKHIPTIQLQSLLISPSSPWAQICGISNNEYTQSIPNDMIKEFYDNLLNNK